MFSVKKNGPNRVDIDYSGKLDVEEMKAALDSLAEQTADIENGRMLFRVGSFELPTMGAMAEELSRLPSMLGLLRKFDRCALLADQQWLKTVAELEGTVIPGVEIKGFGRDEHAAAEAWLAESIA